MMVIIPKSIIKNVAKQVADTYFANNERFQQVKGAEEKKLEDFLFLSVCSFLADDIEGLGLFVYKLIDFLPVEIKDVLINRWNGNIASFNDDFLSAKKYLENAYSIARENQIEEWLIRDILLDLRNSTFRLAEKNKNYGRNTEFLDSLENLEDWNFTPCLDRSLLDGMEDVQNILFKKFTDSPNTIYITDQSIPQTLEHVVEAICYGMCFGSYTYLRVIRDRLAQIFYIYSKNYNSFDLLREALRLFAMEASIGSIKKILETDKERLYAGVSGSPEKLINYIVPKREGDLSKIIRCVLIESLGEYLPDEKITDIEKYLMVCLEGQFSLSETLDLKRSALRSLSKNVERINMNQIISKLLGLISNNRLVNDEILELLARVSWKNITKEVAFNVAKKLVEIKTLFHSSNKLYEILLEIRNDYGPYNPEYESSLLKECENLKSLDAVYYFSKLTGEDYQQERQKIALEILERLEKGNSVLHGQSPVIVSSFGGYNIIYIYFQYASNGIFGNIQRAAEIYKSILENPNHYVSAKYATLNMISVLFHSGNKLAVEYGPKIVESCYNDQKKVLKYTDDDLFKEGYKERLELKLHQMYLAFSKKLTFDEIVVKSSEYLMNGLRDIRLEAVEFLKEALNICSDSEKNALFELLYMKTFDSSETVRLTAITALNDATMNKTNWSEICIKRMKILVKDSNDLVRNSVVISARKGLMNSKNEGYVSILEWAKLDAHYAIRNRAKKALEEFLQPPKISKREELKPNSEN